MLILAELALALMWLRLAMVCGLGIAARLRSRAAKPCPLPASGEPQQRVSVVVPALNEVATISATLQSILLSELKPWEIIVVDDGSSDATAEVARRYLTSLERWQVIRLPANLGKAEALNVGIKAASGELVATIDADTRLERGALQSAVASLNGHDASAVAFYLEVENRLSLLGRVQRQEYVGALNFERAGQSVIGAISILPGAATLFRRAVFSDLSYSLRTRTEDADLTLHLARRGFRLVVAEGAVANTLVPATWADLISQRVRWTAGHLQCCAEHMREQHAASWKFAAVVYPNFLLSTVMVAVGFIAMLVIILAGHTPILGLDWVQASVISALLVYVQRACACAADPKRYPRPIDFFLEPVITNIIGAVSFLGASLSLLRAHRGRRPANHFHEKIGR